MSSGDDELPVPVSNATGQPCTGHPHDVRCIECATVADLTARMDPHRRDVPHQKAGDAR